jgi:myosin-1
MATRADLKRDMSDDLVLMEDMSEAALTATLEARYVRDSIYAYIGPVIIVVNPYKTVKSATGVSIYDDSYVRAYRGKQMIEVPPHTFSVAEAAYRAYMSGSATDNSQVRVVGAMHAPPAEAAVLRGNSRLQQCGVWYGGGGSGGVSRECVCVCVCRVWCGCMW